MVRQHHCRFSGSNVCADRFFSVVNYLPLHEAFSSATGSDWESGLGGLVISRQVPNICRTYCIYSILICEITNLLLLGISTLVFDELEVLDV